jgi:hypothetical protein
MKYPVKYARPLIYWEAIGLLNGLLYFTNRIPKMLKRAPNIEIAILDSRQHKIEIQYSQFSNDVFTERTVKLTFKKFEKELIELILIAPTKIYLFDDDEFGEGYIENIKAFENGDGLEISLDPYDERIDEIEDRDNYVFKSKGYEIHTTKI